ncbi:MAG: hypothetical protein QOE11_2673 [Solirubrobacteraceae bacterium]|jgi:hypothetical protein|nr:hypothetical protein [Solirubrobacteraceae bacterium]
MLIDTRGWEPEDEQRPAAPSASRSLPHLPWRPFAWIAVFAWLLVIAAAVDGFAGYGIFLLAIALGSWRLERSVGRWELGRSGDSGAWY